MVNFLDRFNRAIVIEGRRKKEEGRRKKEDAIDHMGFSN